MKTIPDATLNAAAAEQHVKRIIGPTILMGDGSYFDFEAPETTTMSIEDYAWGLASNNRFRGQTRYLTEEGVGPRCLYNVCQHVVLLAEQMLRDDQAPDAVYEGLMHESDEVPWPDIAGPAKQMLPQEARDIINRSGEGIDRHFGVTHRHKPLIKQYDLRMLATEKRELMPHSGSDRWAWIRGYEPFDFRISCWAPEKAVGEFLHLYHSIRAELETWNDGRP